MDALPPLDEAYRRYLPALIRSLGRLTALGVPIHPSDGLDLAHGFFADHWDGLQDRYDPAQGAADRYVLAAFDRYARREATRDARRRATLLDPTTLQDIAEAPPPQPVSQTVWDDALDDVPQAAQTLLRVFFEYGSERATARALGWSRYRLRAALAQAVGQVALAVGRPAGVAPDDWRVSALVFEGDRTPDQAARLLGRTAADARQAHRRVLRALLAALR